MINAGGSEVKVVKQSAENACRLCV